MNIQRRSFTLIEVMIAFCLISIVMYVLFGSFKSSVEMSAKVGKVKLEILERGITHQRLLKVFSLLDSTSIKQETSKSSKHSTISFIFNNGVEPSLIYSGDVRGELFVNSENYLILRVWPSKSGEAVRDEKLDSDIEEIVWDLKTKDVLIINIKKHSGSEFSYAFLLAKSDNKGYSI